MDRVYIPCAQRTRNYVGKGVQIELNPSQAANAITSVAKDSMMVEAKILGYYIKRNRRAPTKGVVYDATLIAPCLTQGMGSGGNIVPTIVMPWRWKRK